jgi:hypothetical protein
MSGVKKHLYPPVQVSSCLILTALFFRCKKFVLIKTEQNHVRVNKNIRACLVAVVDDQHY